MLEWDDRKDTEVYKDLNKPILERENFIIEGFKYMSEFPEFIFKGASLLQNINSDIDSLIYRETKDIDITNIGLKKEDIKLIMEEFIIYLDKNFDISKYIIKENEKTINSESYYTVDFINKHYNEISFNIDFSVAAEYGQGYLYNFYFDEIIGYDVNKIFSDKMSTISTKQIFSRIKDFVDIYNLSLNTKYEISFNKIVKFNNLNEDFKVGDFRQLLTMKDNIKKAFKKMNKIQIFKDLSKDEVFEIMYPRVVDFVTPFFIQDNHNFKNSIWNPYSGSWIMTRR